MKSRSEEKRLAPVDRSPSFWIIEDSKGARRFTDLQDGMTVGSARSCGIPITNRSCRPLEGIFKKEGSAWYFISFDARVRKEIRSSSNLKIAGSLYLFFDDQEFYKLEIDQIWSDFRDCLKSSGMDQPEKAIDEFKSRRILGAQVPQSIESRLLAHYKELRLQGPVEILLNDSSHTDIFVEDWDKIVVESKGELKESSLQFSNKRSYRLYLENLLNRHGKQIDENAATCDFMISEDVRAHLIGPPLTNGKYYLSIRKAKAEIWTLEDLRKTSFLSEGGYRYLCQCVEKRKTILISGSTGSGKTSLLNAILDRVPSNERLVVIEDTPEIRLDRKNIAFLRTRLDSDSELIRYSMSDLLKQSLRMRPDRIVIGELRSEEAQDFINAINTGHRGSFSTIHANSTTDSVWRLKCLVQASENRLPSEATSELIARNVDTLIHCGRDENNQRKVQQIAEIHPGEDRKIRIEAIHV